MRALLILLLTLGVSAAVHAAAPAGGATNSAVVTTNSATRIVKVLPLFLDAEGRDSQSPSLFERDAYQAHLRENTNKVSGIRYAIQWSAPKSAGEQLKLRTEIRSVSADGTPRFKTIETPVTSGASRKWTHVDCSGDDYKALGNVVAWRVSIWSGDTQMGRQQSFLW